MIEELINYYPEEELLKADGFDDAILGVSDQMNQQKKLIYSVSKCLDILVKRDGMTHTEAIEFFGFNVTGAYVGEKTPIWCYDAEYFEKW